VRERVRNAMLKIGTDEQGRKLLLRVPIKQLGLASIDDYLPLRDMGLQRFYLKPN
ncbi:MAG: phosphate ABC transporter, partial [Rhodobacteraceae bacterium]|nr:phosphate ABC transporter [Paracoccaceae bacterium]